MLNSKRPTGPGLLFPRFQDFRTRQELRCPRRRSLQEMLPKRCSPGRNCSRLRTRPCGMKSRSSKCGFVPCERIPSVLFGIFGDPTLLDFLDTADSISSVDVASGGSRWRLVYLCNPPKSRNFDCLIQQPCTVYEHIGEFYGRRCTVCVARRDHDLRLQFHLAQRRRVHRNPRISPECGLQRYTRRRRYTFFRGRTPSLTAA
jgi:hypothetical protein